MTAAPREDGVEGRDGVGRAGHANEVQGFEEAGGGGQEGGVEGAAGCGDYLAGAAGDRV